MPLCAVIAPRAGYIIYYVPRWHKTYIMEWAPGNDAFPDLSGPTLLIAK